MDNEKLDKINQEIALCHKCKNLVEKFPKSSTISFGKSSDIVILGEAPANNGWRKSGKAWYDINGKLLPSGVVLQKLLALRNLSIEDTTFLEAIKCFPIKRSSLNKCSTNCHDYLIKQLIILKPKVILSLGDSATRTILNIKYNKFSEIVGSTFFLEVADLKIRVIPVYHPSPINPNSYKGNEKIFKLFEI